MDAFGQVEPARKYNRLAIVSFILGLTTIVFPIVSIVYFIAANGGAGYLQSLFCGIPVTLESIIAGIVSLLQIRKKNQQGDWMAILGIVFGVAVFAVSCSLVFVLIAPYLFGGD